MNIIFCLLSCGDFESNRLTFGARLAVEVEVCTRATLSHNGLTAWEYMCHWCFQLHAGNRDCLRSFWLHDLLIDPVVKVVNDHMSARNKSQSVHLTLKGSASLGL
jgi:hypothetical protein